MTRTERKILTLASRRSGLRRWWSGWRAADYAGFSAEGPIISQRAVSSAVARGWIRVNAHGPGAFATAETTDIGREALRELEGKG